MWVCLGTNDDDSSIPDMESISPSDDEDHAAANSSDEDPFEPQDTRPPLSICGV
ncbi:hypothetical protein K466DRAFT_607499 [Polyporus arcularius HHB13444]|uniref:Uncharacterized protein n=1 Tax=Polyporus arcularius HHB13444 TaxID=1314778 RepID=A0A5C3NKC9_9APHY|nr:hypothetical protein K466DRAFT_607499 [Polyporus arcularius HHB13444]